MKGYLNDNAIDILHGSFSVNGKACDIIDVDASDDYCIRFQNQRVEFVNLPIAYGAGMRTEAFTHEMAHMCHSVISGRMERLLKTNHGMPFSGSYAMSVAAAKLALDNECRVGGIQLRIASMIGYADEDIHESIVPLAHNFVRLAAFSQLSPTVRAQAAKLIRMYYTQYTAEAVGDAWSRGISYIHDRSIYRA